MVNHIILYKKFKESLDIFNKINLIKWCFHKFLIQNKTRLFLENTKCIDHISNLYIFCPLPQSEQLEHYNINYKH